jgi:hypothetical protein
MSNSPVSTDPVVHVDVAVNVISVVRGYVSVPAVGSNTDFIYYNEYY